jgi:hypothetical protein
LRRLYLFDRILHGNPFWHFDEGLRPAQNPRHSYSSFAEDAHFLEKLRQLKQLGPKPVLFHLAFYPEIKSGKEYLASKQEQALLESLEKLVEVKILGTTDYIAMPAENPERMNSAPDDFHPSLWGMEIYAGAVADALTKETRAKRVGRR